MLLLLPVFSVEAQEFEKTIFTDVFIEELPELLPDQLQSYQKNLQKRIGSDFQFTNTSFLRRINDKDAKKLYQQLTKKKNFKGNAAIYWKPHHVLYFVNQGEIVSIVAVCLECNKLVVYPTNEFMSNIGLTASFHLYLRSLLHDYFKFSAP